MKRKKSESPLDRELDLSRLDEMSDTELVQVARLLGFENASRAYHRDDLVAMVLGEVVTPEEVEDPLQEIREKIHNYVRGNRRIMVSMLMCDLHCPPCPHDKVVECYATNMDIIDNEEK